VTWAGAYALYQRLDGSIWFGVAVYLYLTRRAMQRRLRHTLVVVQAQSALLGALATRLAVAQVDVAELFGTDDGKSKEKVH